MGKRALVATVLLAGVVAAQDGAAWKLPDAGPYVFWATYPEPLPATPETGFGALRPKLERYFDEHIVVNR